MHHSAEACSRWIITVVHKASSGNRFSISNLDPNVAFFNRLCGSPKCTAKSSWFAQLDPLQTMDLLEDRAAMINLALPNPCHLGNENKRPVYLLCIGYFLATQWKTGLKHVNMWEMIVYKLVTRIPFLTKQHFWCLFKACVVKRRQVPEGDSRGGADFFSTSQQWWQVKV